MSEENVFISKEYFSKVRKMIKQQLEQQLEQQCFILVQETKIPPSLSAQYCTSCPLLEE